MNAGIVQLSTHEHENKIKRYSRVQCKVMHDFTYRTCITYTVHHQEGSEHGQEKETDTTPIHGMLLSSIKGDEELLAVSASDEGLCGS
jgi:hypothetical protein